MIKTLLFTLLTLGACSPSFSEKQGAYHYQGKDNLVVRFSEPPDAALLEDTALMVSILLAETPSSLKAEKIEIDGLGKDSFYNLFVVGEALFLGGVKPYENTMLVYAFLSSRYEAYLKRRGGVSPVPLDAFNALAAQTEGQPLNSYLIQYAIDGLFFVSLLEMLDRPQRYFFPAKTKEDLFRVLFYPELTGFWNYMAGRFGTGFMLETAQQAYSSEYFAARFGEKFPDIEEAFVAQAQKEAQTVVFASPTLKGQWDEALNLYMTGTKQSLMKE